MLTARFFFIFWFSIGEKNLSSLQWWFRQVWFELNFFLVFIDALRWGSIKFKLKKKCSFGLMAKDFLFQQGNILLTDWYLQARWIHDNVFSTETSESIPEAFIKSVTWMFGRWNREKNSIFLDEVFHQEKIDRARNFNRNLFSEQTIRRLQDELDNTTQLLESIRSKGKTKRKRNKEKAQRKRNEFQAPIWLSCRTFSTELWVTFDRATFQRQIRRRRRQ